MFRPVWLAVLVCSLTQPLSAADVPKSIAKGKEAGQIDPQQFKTVCETADVVVLGKAFAVLTGTLDSEPPTPVYTNAQLETKGLKFLKGREKQTANRVADAFAALAQPAETLMDKPVLVAFKWDGKNPKLMMVSAVNAADLAMIVERYPEAK